MHVVVDGRFQEKVTVAALTKKLNTPSRMLVTFSTAPDNFDPVYSYLRSRELLHEVTMCREHPGIGNGIRFNKAKVIYVALGLPDESASDEVTCVFEEVP